MRLFKKHLMAAMLSLAATAMWAQGPNNTGNYYQTANGKSGKALKTALWNILKNPKVTSYSGLWTAYKQSDVDANGYIYDVYSDITRYRPGVDQAGSYSKEGDCYNREHSFPKSWFSEGTPMVSDLVHVIPSDGYVNNRRGNLPFGETDRPTYESHGGFSKVGPSSVSGYSGTIFEPNDIYKGDLARIYFYMATTYEDRITGWHSDMLSGNKENPYKTWAQNMLMKWSKNDKVSDKEIKRNVAIYNVQHNRNPFVDYPGLEEYIWGSKQNEPFSYDNYGGAVIIDEDTTQQGGGTVIPDDPGTDPDNPTVIPGDTPAGEQLFRRVNAASEIEAGSSYIIVYETGSKALANEATDYRLGADISIASATITTAVGANNPHVLLLGGKAGSYTLYDTDSKKYLALTADKNKLHSVSTAEDNDAQWDITFEGSTVHLYNKRYSNREIQYNMSSPRFATYTGSQQPVALYKNVTPTAIEQPAMITVDVVDVYAITGVKVRQKVSIDNAFRGLKRGMYIVNGKKYIIR